MIQHSIVKDNTTNLNSWNQNYLSSETVIYPISYIISQFVK